ncbi:uncharacterized protein LOC144142400 isoform X1 [Haemaphysalis longicornis]
MAMLADLSRGSSGVVPQSQDMRVAVSAADKGVQCSPGCVHQATQAGLTSLSSRGCQTAARLTAQVFYGPAGKVKSLSKPPGYSAATKRWEATSTGGSLAAKRVYAIKQFVKSCVAASCLVKQPGRPSKRAKSAASRFQQHTALLNKIAQGMQKTPEPDDGCAAFGKVVAGYLRKMPAVQRAQCQAAIMSVIMKHLSE